MAFWRKLTDGMLNSAVGAGAANARTWMGIPIAINVCKDRHAVSTLANVHEQLAELREMLEIDEIPIRGRVKCDAILSQIEGTIGKPKDSADHDS
jgi:hypothetical protein